MIIKIYKRPGKFVSALFESYADLKDTERDCIIKKDLFNILKTALKIIRLPVLKCIQIILII